MTTELVKTGEVMSPIAGTIVEKLEKQTRTPRSYDAITAGAMLLDLKDRVALRDKLINSIKDEVEKLESDFLNAKKLLGE